MSEKTYTNEQAMNEILAFIQKCDEDFARNQFPKENSDKAKGYLSTLKHIKRDYNSNIIDATIKKLGFIIKQIDEFDHHDFEHESVLNLVPLSVTDYIIDLINKKKLTDPLLIARYAYIELSKVLYYDISYVKQDDAKTKRLICDTPADVHNEKIFSYVVCTQWLQLYSYILAQFGINVIKRSIPGQDHVWGEIELDSDHIIIVDATEYINSSIDLSNAKSNSPTVGFAVLPKRYSQVKLYDVFSNPHDIKTAQIIKSFYELNRELDIELGYITNLGYPSEIIIQGNEIFQRPASVVAEAEMEEFIKKTLEFFKKLKVPNNMDGYEIFAYYYTFIRRLPKNILPNVSQKTLYVDSFSYRQSKMSEKFLQAPQEYLKYLEDLISRRYRKYLDQKEQNALLEQMRRGDINAEQVRDSIARFEMMIAEINRNINFYYAINKLHFFAPYTGQTLRIQLYEPMMGTRIFRSQETFSEFEKKISLR